MERHYTVLKLFEQDGFTIIVDKTWEELDPSHCFDDTVTDIDDICDKINNYELDWFMLRVRVMVENIELASEYLGGCLYERAEDVLGDGTADDLIGQALEEAKDSVYRLSKKFAALSAMVDSEDYSPYNTVNT